MPTNPQLEDSRQPLPTRFQPGFFTEGSPREAPTRWRNGSLVRFHNGQPQKMGGYVQQPVTDTFAGRTGGNVGFETEVFRRVHEWSSLDGETWIAIAGNYKLYLLNRGLRYNITPLRRTINRIAPFATTMGSLTVVVTDPDHAATVNDSVFFTGASSVAGLVISGEYTIRTILGDTYTILVDGIAATSSTTGGGTVKIEYELGVGSSRKTLALGWGVGGWGVDAWGTARDIANSGIVRRLRKWSLDNFGEDLLASPRGDAIYHWDRSNGPTSRAQLLEQAPRTNQRVLVSNSGGQIICLGAFDAVGNTPDRMLIRVGAEESLTDFTVALNSTAFDKRLSVGTEVVTGVRCRSGIFISTDEANYLMQESASEIFTVDKIAEGDTPIGPDAMIEVNGTVYYMARSKKFMRYDGVLEEIPCEVWEHVFTGTSQVEALALGTGPLDPEQADKVYCWYNEAFHEVWWMYPGFLDALEEDDTDVSYYVVYNVLARIWYFGRLQRSVFLPPGATYNKPTGLNLFGNVFTHEDGVNAGTVQLPWFLESHDVELANGKEVMHVSKVVPDFSRMTGDMLATLKGKKRPRAATYIQKGPYTITPTTEEKGVKISARQIALRLTPTGVAEDIDDDFRLATWTFYTQPDGEV